MPLPPEKLLSNRRALFIVLAASALMTSAGPAAAQLAQNRYTVVLSDEPAARRFSSRADMLSVAGQTYRQQVETRQLAVRTRLAERGIRVTGSASTLVNAVFVAASADRVAEIESLPGVVAVVPQRMYKLSLNRATELIGGPAAWNLSGGFSGAGKGMKIAIIDTGVDQNHPAFQDPSLPMPAGFPKCAPADCAFTSNKVIVARSYVRMQSGGSNPANPAADTKPDDFSPRDRVGHGTATASAAAGNSVSSAVAFSGMAPKAYIGNYKIFGSPGMHDGATTEAIVAAAEDAVQDGMDVLSLSVGGPAFTGPLDSGAACTNVNGGKPNPAGVYCDLAAVALETAVKNGIIVVVAAGNAGESGVNQSALTLNSVDSPAFAPGVIAVGATTNSHSFVSAVSVSGADVPARLRTLSATFASTSAPDSPLTGALADVAKLGNDGLACTALTPGSLLGQIALIERGSCLFSLKMNNAVLAGAAGVIFYMADSGAPLSPGGLAAFGQPALMLSNSDGVALKTFIDANAGHAVTLNPLLEQPLSVFNQLAGFSSAGPSLGLNGMKPEVLAPGTNIYMATQSFDPLGDLFSTNGYTTASGTSFATPLTAGAAALVKQNHRDYSPEQVKSALVNTATQDVALDQFGSHVNVLGTGGGKVAADAAIANNITISPPTVSLGALTAQSLPAAQKFQVTNTGATPVTLSLSLVITAPAGGTTLALDKNTLALAPAASGNFSLTLSGTLPPAGVYYGAVSVQGASQTTRIPYMFLTPGAALNNLIPLSGDFNDGTVNQPIPDGYVSFLLIDSSGLPLAKAPVSFTASPGVTLARISAATDEYGIAYANVAMGPVPGNHSVTGCAAASCTSAQFRYDFTLYSRLAPEITAAGVLDAASFRQPIAPGSYIAIFGKNMTDNTLTPDSTGTNQNTSLRLPLNIDLTQVSFDVPAAGISVPAPLTYISPGQLVAQVPWELAGQKSAQMKVIINDTYGNVVTVPLSDYAPAFFEVSGTAIAVDLAGHLVTATNPAVRGQPLTFYANGLGPVTDAPATGEPAKSAPLSFTRTPPVVTIGGQNASIQFSGLTPTLPGLYQINLTVPQNAAIGAVPVTLTTTDGKTSKPLTIPVK